MIGLAVLTLGGHARAQGFKSRVDIVRTDVSVIDNKTGKPVAGLNEQDFTITEDGVRQTITTFVAESGAAESGRRDETGGPRRTWLFIVAYDNRSATAEPYDRLARFLRTSLQPDDQAAVLVLNRVTSFTSDGGRLAAVVERAARIPLDLLTEIRRNRQVDFPPEVEAGIDAWLNPGGPAAFLRSTASLVLADPESAEVYHRNRISRAASFPLFQLSAGIEYIRREPGEKRIVQMALWGVSMPMAVRGRPNIDNEPEEEALARRLTSAGIALDLIHTIGTDSGYTSSFSGQNISRLSGGHFTSVRAVDQQLSRIDEASRHGYVIGYTPTNSALDGKYRRITIAVNRKDVTVAYRRGYAAQRFSAGPADWRPGRPQA
jgi:hypothetical protein